MSDIHETNGPNCQGSCSGSQDVRDWAQTQIEELRRENEVLRQQMAALASSPTAQAAVTPATSAEAATSAASEPSAADSSRWSRRALLLGGAGAAIGGLAATAGASPAAAADGPVVLGGDNFANKRTYISSGDPTVTFRADTGEVGASGILGVGAGEGGVGVRGYGNVGTGTYGGSFSGAGVVANSDTGPALRLEPGELRSFPTAADWQTGDTVATADGQFWLCVEAGNPGQWRLLGSRTSAGAYVPLTPARVFDSRVPQPDGGSILAAGTERVIGVGKSRNTTTGAVLKQLLPLGTRGIAVNVTLTGTSGSGFVALTPGDARDFSASAINWTAPNQTLANGLTLTADELLQLKAWVRGGNTHLIVDVMGYFAQV